MKRVGFLDFRFPNLLKDKVKNQIKAELKDRTFLICYLRCSSGKNCRNHKRVIGYSIFGPAERFLKCPIKIKKQGYAVSLGIGIDPDYQRKGIGKKLANYCEHIAIKQGFKGAYGDIASNNKASLNFQASIGFKKIAEYDDTKRPEGIKNNLFFKDFGIWKENKFII